MRQAALARHVATVTGGLTVTELTPFDLIVTGVPRRSSREYAQSEQHARQLAAERFRVPVERVVVRPQPYSEVLGER